MKSQTPSPERGRRSCEVTAGFDGRSFRLVLERQEGSLVGRFMSDGSMWLRVTPAASAAASPVFAIPVRPGPKFARSEADVSPLPLSRRTVRMDEAGGIDLVTWASLTPEEFDRIIKQATGPIVPAKQHKVPLGRCDEYYDHDGRLCCTTWTVAPTTTRRAG